MLPFFLLSLQLLQNLGKVDRTADEIFDDHLSNFNRQQNNAARLQKEFNNYIRCVRGKWSFSAHLFEFNTECRAHVLKYLSFRAFSGPNGIEIVDGCHRRCLRNTVDWRWSVELASVQYRSSLAGLCTQIGRSSAHTAQHIHRSVPGNEGKHAEQLMLICQSMKNQPSFLFSDRKKSKNATVNWSTMTANGIRSRICRPARPNARTTRWKNTFNFPSDKQRMKKN